MKTTLLTLPFLLLFCLESLAQASTNSSVRTVTIDDDGKDPVVTITTVEDGEAEKHTLRGEEARTYLREHEAPATNANAGGHHATAFTLHVDSDTGGETSSSVIVAKSRSENRKQVEVKEDNKQERAGPAGTSAILIEDGPAEDNEPVQLEQLRYAANPGAGSITIHFENPTDEAVVVELTDGNKHSFYQGVVTGRGEKMLSIGLEELSAGSYCLKLHQGDRLTVKKLVIQ